MSSRAYVHLPELVGIDSPNGGVVRSSGESVYAPSTVLPTPTGVALGPLHLGVPEASTCSISALTYLPSEEDDGDGWLIFGVAGGGAVGATEADVEGPSMRRREVLGLAVATLGALAAATRPVAGQEDDDSSDDVVALEIARLTIDATDGPVKLRVLDVVDEVLPPTTELLVDAAATRVGKIDEPSEGVVLKPDVTGEVSVYLRDSRGRLDRLLAWVRGALDRDETIVYARELPQEAAAYAVGEFVTLSSHPALVEPVRESGADGTELRINATEIPHQEDADDSEVGSYGVFDDALIYEPGPNPPASAQWELETRLGLLERSLNIVM